MTLDLKKMLEIKKIGFFLVIEIFVKMFPFSGKEQIRNYRKSGNESQLKKCQKTKLKKVCENDKFRKSKERQQKKLMTI